MIPVLYTSLQQNDDFGLTCSGIHYSATLGANTNESLQAPGSSKNWKALIKVQTGTRVYVALNATAAKPVGATLAATTSEMCNGTLCRQVRSTDVLNFLAPVAATDISVTFYAVD